ncbi:MAG: hypothetical protein FRX48_06812 [Lasallia pustulata]|uniref:Beta-lactamase-related domain-containing protein n=1 Tax=Lasallia pustulata TaxID=136370 RepID=A0A5M8PIM8_9LECA|nr:MAG: hypothetical protein FRX48_06812 [Lasallia pustulata]
MSHTLSESGANGIRQTMDGVTADRNKIPGCVAVVVGKDGKTLFSHASGTRGADTKEPMSMDTIFWIASCTKMICGIACMQLCEEGKITGLDDADLVEKVCPELKSMKILKSVDENGKPEYVEKKNRITIRQLLTHTAGFGYTFFNDDLRRSCQPIGGDEFSGNPKDILELPLTFEPGTQWQYGTGIDWAGTIVERISGMSLNDYFEKNIFQPLGIQNITMFPSQQMKDRLAHMHAKWPDGSIHERSHLLRAPLVAGSPDGIYNSAGAGCFARPEEYCHVLATLLNDGTCPTTGKQILKPETVQEMFKNQIPQFPDFGRNSIPAAKPYLTNPIPDLYPQPPEQAQGWGLTFMLTIHPGATGRGNNTGWWAGLPNLFWWCDREEGIAGMICTQILPFADGEVMGLWANMESQVYAALKK